MKRNEMFHRACSPMKVVVCRLQLGMLLREGIGFLWLLWDKVELTFLAKIWRLFIAFKNWIFLLLCNLFLFIKFFQFPL